MTESQNSAENGGKILPNVTSMSAEEEAEFQRADVETRYEAYSKATVAQWMTRNEIRAKEGLQPIEGLDDFVDFQSPANSNAETE